MEDRKCLKCNIHLAGRIDQKFCSDKCRNAFNNQQYIESNNKIRMVNRILKKNYTILTSLKTEGKTTTTISYLQKKGFRFDYFTNTGITRTSRINYFCYDHGYREQEKNKVILVRRDLKEDMSSPRP